MTVDTGNEIVTLIVRHRVRAGMHDSYEHWLRQIIDIASSQPGHLGIDVHRQEQLGLPLFTCVLRFASAGQLQTWLDSDARKALIAEAAPLLADGDQTEVNAAREFWFTPDANGAPAPPRWKQACITFLVILPLSLLVPQLWQPLFHAEPWLGGHVPSNVLITLTIVLLVVYLFMPRVTRWFAGWLNAR